MHSFYPNIFNITKLLCNVTIFPFLTDKFKSQAKIWEKKDTFFPVGMCLLKHGLSGLPAKLVEPCKL